MYDGNGHDTFFWAGSRPRPGPQGFIVPNELGRWDSRPFGAPPPKWGGEASSFGRRRNCCCWRSSLHSQSNAPVPLFPSKKRSVQCQTQTLLRRATIRSNWVPALRLYRVQNGGFGNPAESMSMFLIDWFIKRTFWPRFLSSNEQTSLYYCGAANHMRHFISFFRARTNVLDRYLNKDLTIRLPGGKRISDIKWLAIYDLTRLVRLVFFFKLPIKWNRKCRSPISWAELSKGAESVFDVTARGANQKGASTDFGWGAGYLFFFRLLTIKLIHFSNPMKRMFTIVPLMVKCVPLVRSYVGTHRWRNAPTVASGVEDT